MACRGDWIHFDRRCNECTAKFVLDSVNRTTPVWWQYKKSADAKHCHWEWESQADANCPEVTSKQTITRGISNDMSGRIVVWSNQTIACKYGRWLGQVVNTTRRCQIAKYTNLGQASPSYIALQAISCLRKSFAGCSSLRVNVLISVIRRAWS